MRRTYRLSQNVRPLIWVECTVEKHSRSRTEYLVKARSAVQGALLGLQCGDLPAAASGRHHTHRQSITGALPDCSEVIP